MSDWKYVGPTAVAKLAALVKTALASKADKTNATTSAAGLMSAADKTKLDGIAEGATKITVDSELSTTSTNPVENKAVKGALDAKAEKTALDGKLNVTGGTIFGDLKVKTNAEGTGNIDVDGEIRVKSGTARLRDVYATNTVHSDLMVEAPSFILRAPLSQKSVEVKQDGDAAVKMECFDGTLSKGYARLKIGTPTEDDDATTKAYVDGLAAEHEAITVTSTKVSDLGYDASNGASRYSVTFDASFDSILANLAANKPMKFNITLPDSTGGFPVSFSTGYVSALNDSDYLFTGTILNYPVVLSIGALGSATVELFGAYLPDPNPDDSDDGKSLVVNGHKWVMKKAAAGSNITVDATLSSTSTNPVQNKAVKMAIDAKADKTALDGKMDKAGGTFTGNVYGQYFVGTWLQTTAATDLGRAPGKIAVLDDSGWVYHRTPAELLADIGAATVSAMLDKAYPVGAIYMSVNSANPQNLFGGTWVQIKDRFLLAAGTTYKAGTTGGEAAHALTVDEMPNHQHVLWYPNAGGEQSAAIGYPEAGSKNTWYAEASKTGGAGGGAAHNNMPPYLAVYVWKRTA